MANKLKDLKITSTDLVTAGANPDAHIRLFKRRDAPQDGEPSESFIQKIAASLAGIFGKSSILQSDCDTPPVESPADGPDGESADGDDQVGKTHSQKKEEADIMKIDKSKMTPEEQATLAEFEKKYGIAEPDTPPAVPAPGVTKSAEPSAATPAAASAPAAGTVSSTGDVTRPELHPEVKKALEDNAALAAQVEELRKSLEMKDLTVVAKKYEMIGKKADELAPKLYSLKKAGGTAYDDTIALLDEQVALVEKSGLFGELGLNTSGGIGAGGELEAKAAEIRKGNAGMSQADALAEAYETYPDLAAQYEKTYQGRA